MFLFVWLQNGFPSRDGSMILRYIPDPTDLSLDEAFQPAPGECFPETTPERRL